MPQPTQDDISATTLSADLSAESENIRKLYSNKFKFYRIGHGLLIGLHFSLAFGSLYYDYNTLDSDFAHLKRLDMLIVLYAFTYRLTWYYLFRNPHEFLGFRRPGRTYYWIVYLLSFITTLPNLLLQLIAVAICIRIQSFVKTSLVTAILRAVVFLAVCTVYIYLLRRFFLQDNDKHYEPILLPVPDSPGRPSGTHTSAVELYYDSTSNNRSSEDALNSHLARVYAVQWATSRLISTRPSQTHRQSQGDIDQELLLQGSHSQRRDIIQTSSPDSNPIDHHRCLTIAKYDFMCASQTSLHSWFSLPMISVSLGIYSVFIASMIAQFAYEDMHARLPSSKARYGLLAPIGGLLFCVYATRLRLRKSLFTRIIVPLPKPWIQIGTLSGTPLFRHTEAHISTKADPRFRVFPQEAERNEISKIRKNYLKEYNLNSSTKCADYWGHLGRAVDFQARTGKPLLILLFLGLSFFLFMTGLVCILNYPVTRKDIDRFWQQPDITKEDVERLFRLIRKKAHLMVGLAPIFLFIITYSVTAGISLVVLWAQAILEHPTVDKSGP